MWFLIDSDRMVLKNVLNLEPHDFKWMEIPEDVFNSDAQSWYEEADANQFKNLYFRNDALVVVKYFPKN